jgi:hypothetical protein
MPEIEEADNAHNNFSGEIPSQLENLSNLGTLLVFAIFLF